MKILVTGGAGYIGSITVKRLLKEGHEVVVFDNLVYGHKASVNCPLIVGDLTDKEFLFKSLEQYNFDGVIHFAGYAYAGESMQKPYKYFYNNLVGGLNLLELMVAKKIPSVVFSSSCTIFGTPEKLPVSEQESLKTENVYGESKAMFEKMLTWYDKIFNIKSIAVRYFNAAGGALDGTLGEDHDPETHIIPIAIQVALGKRKEFELYGDNYPTPDGTCIRDYIHIEDLATAHLLALKKLAETKKSDVYNLGTGKGYSNKEILQTIEKVTGKTIPVVVKDRRFGDATAIYADNTKAREVLGFTPKYSDLETIIKTAWDWHKKQA
ncbi:MAG TPA: UDP-glucose 4-epimerase GalE [Patescibacteria group bacterium]|nr:UDP-glucose 4-epimerase GalE [Patescibacteria group bacterium]